MTLERRIPWVTKNTQVGSTGYKGPSKTATSEQVNMFTPRGTPFFSHKASKEGLSAWSWIRLDRRMKQSAKTSEKVDPNNQPLPGDVSLILHDS